VPLDQRIEFRIGIHVGDIIIDDNDIFGDGVNVAARLEAKAPVGGIVISRNIHEAVAGRLKASFNDLGNLALKNIERPVQAFVVKWEEADWKVKALSDAASPVTVSPSLTADIPLELPDKPSIAVLPFQNMSGDPVQEYFVDGLVEDIITALSRFRSLFVIARNSSFSYKGKSPDIRQVGRELGVRYVLEGSIRKSADRVRLTAQLIDTLTGNHIWAERYDRVLEDVFAVQEEVTQAIVAVIAPQIDSAEQSKATRRRPDNLSAYEIAVRAWVHGSEGVSKVDQTLLDQSILEARKALSIDPNSVLALRALTRAYSNSVFYQMTADREHAIREATSANVRAIELDADDPLLYAQRAMILVVDARLDRFPDALRDARRAHEMNPNDANVLRVLALVETYVGEHEQAIKHLHQVLRLTPRDPYSFLTYNHLALASFGAKLFAEGIDWAARALNEMPSYLSANYNRVLCLVGTGEVDKAKAAFISAHGLAPEYFRARLGGTSFPVFARPEDRQRAIIFLRVAAGLDDPSAADALR
jgi:adenylate cyclase